MANVYTSTDSGSLGTSLVVSAYDKLVEFALRSQPMLRSVADKRPVNVTSPGTSVTFQIYNDLAVATSALTETTDPDSVGIPSTSSVAVTLNEYGNVALVTRKLQLTSLTDVDPGIANILAFNMADSIDEVVQTTLVGGTNIRYAKGSDATRPTARNQIDATNTLKAEDIRFAVAKLRAGKAVARKGSLYWCAIHPEVSHDLREETGSASWRLPHEYNESQNIWAGEIGTFEGAYFIESPRLKNATDGASSARVFRTLIAGQQALAEAVAEEPHVVAGPVTDKLMRFRPLGWYGMLGFARYREASLYRIESSSSINAA
jgi:N4-gp56 family major capsid protein